MELKIGTKLYYTDEPREYFGEVVKILKRDVHVKLPDGSIRTNWQKSFATKMMCQHETVKSGYSNITGGFVRCARCKEQW